MNVLFVSGMDGDTRRYRCIHHQEQLALAGVESSLLVDDDLEIYAAAATCDVAILHRVPWSDLIADLVTLIHQRNKPVLFETDDLVFEPGLHDRIGLLDMLDPAEAQRLRASLAGQAETFRRADFALVTTEYLAQAAEKAGVPARVHRNACSAEMLAIAEEAYATQLERRHDQGTVIAAYFSGTGSHNRDFASITPSLLEAMAAYPQLHLHLSGHLQIDPAFDAFADRIRRAPYVSWRELPYLIAQVDINLAPLELDNPFCQAKSEIKYTEAALVGVPTVASATDAFRYAITPGETGLLAESPDDWTAALARLIDDPDARHALGDRARAETLQRYSPQERSAQLIALLEDVLDGFSSPDAAPQRVPETMARCLLRRLRALEEKRAQQDQQLVQLRQTLAGWEQSDQTLFWRREQQLAEKLLADDLRQILARLQAGR
ncbi:MAG: glycosyltransferase [Chloroflexota bacterium]|nr:glycosyltransferase [Chloroflexota bacterium]